jgi:integrase/recombinase XerC
MSVAGHHSKDFPKVIGQDIPKGIAEYLQHLVHEGRSPHTVNAYRRDLRAFERFAMKEKLRDLGDVTPEALTRFMASPEVTQDARGRGRAPASVNRYRVALKALYAFLEQRWLVSRNPTAILRCQRHRGLPPTILRGHEITRLVNSRFAGNVGARDHALVCFMLLTGCRLAETAALDITDIDLVARVAILRTTKGGDPDRVMISPRLAKILAAHVGRRTAGPLFTAHGRRLSTRQIQRIVTARVQEAGITKPITAHSLRHSFACLLYNATGDIRLVQQALRHSHVSSTELYAQVEPARWRRAVAKVA